MTTRSSSNNRRCGFTLIELLVVVAIIALLISILLPSLKAAKDKAKYTKCAANLKTLILNTRIYADEYKGFLPPSNWIVYRHSREVPLRGWLYAGRARNFDRKLRRRRRDDDLGLLWPYTKNEELYRCPMHIVDETYRGPNGRRARDFSWLITSYLMNGATNDFEGDADRFRCYQVDKFRVDAVIFWEPPFVESVAGLDFDEQGCPPWYSTWNDGSSFPSEYFTQRHGGEATVAHIDGHCSTYTESLWRKHLEHGPSPLWCAPGYELGGGPE